MHAVDGVSFTVNPSHIVGCSVNPAAGKTITGLLAMPCCPAGDTSTGQIQVGGTVLGLSERQMRKVRGNRIAMIFQDPMACLNPTITVGDQIASPR